MRKSPSRKVGQSPLIGSFRWPAALGAARDGQLSAGTEAHYTDARYYTATYSARTDDVDYFVDLAAEHASVLEYGCGNGRIAIPIARRGVDITGVDMSRAMLDDFRKLLALEPREVQRRVRLRRGDMRQVKLRERFGLVLCTFNTFLHLYTRDDVERYCARVREHMTPRGRFVIDVTMPDPEELCRDPDRLYRMPRFRHAGSGEVVRYGERFDYDNLHQVLFVEMEFEPGGRANDRWITPLAHRQFFPQELEALLHYNGFEVVEVHGDFAREAVSNESVELAYHCKLRRGFRR